MTDIAWAIVIWFVCFVGGFVMFWVIADRSLR